MIHYSQFQHSHGLNAVGGKTRSGFNPQGQNPKGFTLMEMLIVATIVGLVMVVAGSVLVNTVTVNNKVDVTNKARLNGSRALEIMENKIRSARRVVAPAPNTTNATLVDIENIDGTFSRFQLVSATSGTNGVIVQDDSPTSNFASATRTKLTDDAINTFEGVSVSNFLVQTDASGRSVKVAFKIYQSVNLPGLVQFRVNGIDFATSSTIRN